MAKTDPKMDRKAPRWMKIVLGLSLAVNLLIFGVIFGAAMRHGEGWREAGGNGMREGFALLAALDREDRRAILREVRTVQDRSARRAQITQLLALLRAETLDVAALQELIAEQRSMGAQMQELMAASWTARIERMGAAERAAYADRLESWMSRRGPRHGKANGGDKG